MSELAGWILLAVQFNNGSSALFRIEYYGTRWLGGGKYDEPSITEMEQGIFASTHAAAETLHFLGEKFDAENREWTEACWVKIPSSSYSLASWNYYAKDDPKWEGPQIETPSENP